MKRFNTTSARTSALLVIAISSAFSAHAEETTSLDTLQVTANRSEIATEKTLASVTVLSRADIEMSQAPGIPELLSQQAGLDITRTGGAGSNVSVFTRGSNSNHTLILIDGVRVNTSVQGSFDFSHLPLAMVERIEIVRGPRAAIWGSDAIGGVIQIFTRDPNHFAEIRAGSYGRVEADVGFGMGDADNNVGIVLGYGRLNGFSATNANASFGFDPDNDGYRNRHLLLRGKTAVGSQHLSAFALVTKADIEFDQGESEQDNRQIGVNLAGDIATRWHHSLSLNHSYENVETPIYSSVFGSRRLALDWVNTLDVNEQNRFNIGVNWSREQGYSSDAFVGPKYRRNAAVFGAWRGEFSANTLELSLRYDDNSQFGDATTAQAAWGYEFNEQWRLRASWGQGFRAPNYNELYYPGFFGFFAGNPDLQPERSDNFELGLHWNISSRQAWEISAFRSRIDDLIAFEGVNFTALNVNKAALDGVEMEYQFIDDRFSLKANASWLDARNENTGAKLLRRADRKINVQTNFTLSEQWSWGLDLEAASPRPDFGSSTAGYGRLDARVSFHFSNNWTLDARVENILDHDYELVRGYNTPDRSGLLSLRWNGKN